MTTPAASSADQTGRATSERTPTGASTLLGLLIPALPASRITALRTIVYAFVIVDVLLIANDVPSVSYTHLTLPTKA